MKDEIKIDILYLPVNHFLGSGVVESETNFELMHAGRIWKGGYGPKVFGFHYKAANCKLVVSVTYDSANANSPSLNLVREITTEVSLGWSYWSISLDKDAVGEFKVICDLYSLLQAF